MNLFLYVPELTVLKKGSLVHAKINGIGNGSGELWTGTEEQWDPAVLRTSRADSEDTWLDPKEQKKGRCALPSLTPRHFPQSIGYICCHLKAKTTLKVSMQMC